MALKLEQLDSKLRERIRRQIAAEDSAKHGISVLGRLETSQPERPPALARRATRQQGRKSCVEVRVSFTALLRRTLDDDNLAASLKQLRDCVARDIGLDDGDPRIAWEYGQQRTDGEPGVMVKVAFV